ncbi:MAG: hypothetical protein QMA97_04820 [Glaciecola sp.]
MRDNAQIYDDGDDDDDDNDDDDNNDNDNDKNDDNNDNDDNDDNYNYDNDLRGHEHEEHQVDEALGDEPEAPLLGEDRLHVYRFQGLVDHALDIEPIISSTKCLDGSYRKGKLRQYICLVEYIARVDRLSEAESTDLIKTIKQLSFMNESEIALPAR